MERSLQSVCVIPSELGISWLSHASLVKFGRSVGHDNRRWETLVTSQSHQIFLTGAWNNCYFHFDLPCMGECSIWYKPSYVAFLVTELRRPPHNTKVAFLCGDRNVSSHEDTIKWRKLQMQAKTVRSLTTFCSRRNCCRLRCRLHFFILLNLVQKSLEKNPASLWYQNYLSVNDVFFLWFQFNLSWWILWRGGGSDSWLTTGKCPSL